MNLMYQHSREDIKLKDLGFNVRTYSCLVSEGIKTLYGIADMTEEELAGIDYLGKSSIKEIKETLELYGLSLRKEGEEFAKN